MNPLGPQTQRTKQVQKLLMMVPDDFMWPEYAHPREVYEQAGIEVQVATKNGQPANPDARNYRDYGQARPLDSDLSFSEVQVDEFDAVTTVGGTGAWADLIQNPRAHRVLAESLQKDKVTGLICASTGTLAMIENFDDTDTSMVKGRQVTGYYKVENILRKVGEVNFVDGAADEVTVVVDGKLVTGRNPQSSRLFGETVRDTLLKSDSQSK